MKHYELVEVGKYLERFGRIFMLRRVDDTVIEFLFDKHESIYVDLKKGSSTWFMCDKYLRQKIYNAPFDVIMQKCFARSDLVSVEVENSNRIMRLHVRTNSQYKSMDYIFQLEFTGKNTNAIILNSDEIVLEALHHIDKKVSFREVSVGKKLLPLPKREFRQNSVEILDICEHLREIHQKRQKLKLDILKHSKHSSIQKKLKRLQKEFDNLDNEDELLEKSEELNSNGSIVLANLSYIKPYSKKVKLLDFEANEREIVFPKETKSPQHAANMLFKQSKKIKQKASFVYKQRDNLTQKINFLKSLDEMVLNAKSANEVQILVPKQQSKTKKSKIEAYESFLIEGFKIMVGKSEKSNIALFKEAKKNDIWLHIKEVPSSHVIVRTNRQNLPQNVLEFAGKLCVNFSGVKKGNYLVDYTKWQYVKINNGANVFYTDYKTLRIDKE